MKILKYAVLTFFTGILFNAVSYSQVIEITLKDAIRHAYNNNPDIKKTENTIEAQESNIRASYGSLFPDLWFTGGWRRTNQVLKGRTQTINGINFPVDPSNETFN